MLRSSLIFNRNKLQTKGSRCHKRNRTDNSDYLSILEMPGAGCLGAIQIKEVGDVAPK